MNSVCPPASRKCPSTLVAIALTSALSFASAIKARAQSGPDDFNPNPNGSLNAILLQPDRKIGKPEATGTGVVQVYFLQ